LPTWGSDGPSLWGCGAFVFPHSFFFFVLGFFSQVGPRTLGGCWCHPFSPFFRGIWGGGVYLGFFFSNTSHPLIFFQKNPFLTTFWGGFLLEVDSGQPPPSIFGRPQGGGGPLVGGGTPVLVPFTQFFYPCLCFFVFCRLGGGSPVALGFGGKTVGRGAGFGGRGPPVVKKPLSGGGGGGTPFGGVGWWGGFGVFFFREIFKKVFVGLPPTFFAGGTFYVPFCLWVGGVCGFPLWP